MPFYDYVCTKCGLRIEVMHSVHGNGPSACSACGGAMKKAVSAPAVHFKGKGWARQDRAITTQVAKERAANAAASSSEGTSSGEGASPGQGTAPSTTGTDAIAAAGTTAKDAD
jgi:putative FmdB family regulatory protein